MVPQPPTKTPTTNYSSSSNANSIATTDEWNDNSLQTSTSLLPLERNTSVDSSTFYEEQDGYDDYDDFDVNQGARGGGGGGSGNFSRRLVKRQDHRGDSHGSQTMYTTKHVRQREGQQEKTRQNKSNTSTSTKK